jgi:hypothetical protein
MDEHVTWLAGAILAAAFVFRLGRASQGFLNPDEVVIFLVAHQHRAVDVWRSILLHPYPPLYSIVLYLWTFIGSSELVARLPSVIFGVGFLWFSFRWMKLAAGDAAALTGLVILSFSPPLIMLSTEVRPYMLQLFCMSVALWFLERAFHEDPVGNLVWFALWSCLSVLSHYQAFWFVLAAGVYALVRIWNRDLPPPAVRVWVILESATFLLCLGLFRYHLLKFRGAWLERYGIDSWLRDSYFHEGSGQAAGFVVSSTRAFFEYFSNQVLLGGVATLLFATGVGLLIWRAVRQQARASAAFAVLLVLPFAYVAAAGWRQLYPYGGSRHDSVLFLFAAAGISVAIAAIVRQRVLPVVLGSLLLVPLWQSNAQDHRYDMAASEQRRDYMQGAMDYLRSSAGAGAILFANRQTSAMLEYYLGDRYPVSPRRSVGFAERWIGGYRVIASDRFAMWPVEFLSEYVRMRELYGIRPEEKVWVVDAVFGPNISYGLRGMYPGLQLPNLRGFGQSVAVFRVPDAAGAQRIGSKE